MNILLATYVFYPEPIAMSGIIADMAQELAQEHNVTVVTSRPCRPLGYSLPEKINKDEWQFKRVVLDSLTYPKTSFVGRARESRSFGKAVCRYIREHRGEIDVVYGAIPPLFGQRDVVKCCGKLEIPVVLHIEDIYPEPFKDRLPGIAGKLLLGLFLPMDRYILSHCTKAIAIGPKLKEYLTSTRGLPAGKVEYVYNWQDDRHFNVEPPQKSGPFTFMYAGSLSIAANLLYVINTYIEAGGKDSRLVFAGSGNLKERLKEIAAEHPECNIEFWEAKGEDIPKIQAQADVMVLPLRKGIALRAFPSKFPAYLFSKKPVLAIVEGESDVADSISQAGCGWIVEPSDSKGLKEMFCSLPSMQPETLDEMGRKGFEYSQQNLTREVNLSKICDIIVNAGNKR